MNYGGMKIMKKIKFKKESIALIPILILSAILNFSNLAIEGYSNSYYASGVKSMTMNFKNFFFVSFDPGGFVSIDKPPLGFWLQAISAKIFGFHGWSILIPQALAGVISVALIYLIVKKSFGNIAGLISAFCLAVTPVFVAVSRNNTCDNLVVLALLAACWAVSIAAREGKLKYLLIGLAMVGVGFNIKMLQAYMIIPAIYLTYLLSSAVSIKKRIIHLLAGTAVLVIVSLSWAVVVDLVPASDRPFVGSSTNNSVLELIFGHNGLERLGIGDKTTPGGKKQGNNSQMPGQGLEGSNSNNNAPQNQYGVGTSGNYQSSMSQAQEPPMAPTNSDSKPIPSGNFKGEGKGIPQGGFGNGGPGGMIPGGEGSNMKRPSGGGQGGGTFGGTEKASITRLFSNNSLSDQIIWLFPLAVFGFIAAAIKENLRFSLDNKRKQALVIWSIWLLPEFVYFSFTKGLFHPYYLTMMAAPIAALVGIGIVSMWELYKEGGWKSWILPAAFIVNGLIQLKVLSYYNNTSDITKVIMIIMSVVTFVASITLIVVKFIKNTKLAVKKILTATALVGLLIIPTVWSFTTLCYKMSGTFPAAGLELKSSKQMRGPMMGNSNSSTAKMIEYLKKNKTNEKYLVAVSSANNYASDIILQSGEAVMALGGFSGSDNILTLSEFKQLVKEGKVRYAIADGGMGGGAGGNNEIMTWIKANGKAISASEWGGTSANTSQATNLSTTGFERNSSAQIYDLKTSLDSTVKNN